MTNQLSAEELEKLSLFVERLDFKGDAKKQAFKPSPHQQMIAPDVLLRVPVMMGAALNCEKPLNKGDADPSYTKKGFTNLKLATVLGHDKVAELLKKHGAVLESKPRPKN